MALTPQAQLTPTTSARAISLKIGYVHSDLTTSDVTVTTSGSTSSGATSMTLSGAPSKTIPAGARVTFANGTVVKLTAACSSTTMAVEATTATIPASSGTWSVLPTFPSAVEQLPSFGQGNAATYDIYGSSSQVGAKSGISLQPFSFTTTAGSTNVVVADLIDAAQKLASGTTVVPTVARRYVYFSFPDGTEADGYVDIMDHNILGASTEAQRHQFRAQWSEPPRIKPAV